MVLRRPGGTVVYLLIYLVLAETSSLVVLDKGTRLTTGVSASLKPLTATVEEAVRSVRVLELPRTKPQCPVTVTGDNEKRCHVLPQNVTCSPCWIQSGSVSAWLSQGKGFHFVYLLLWTLWEFSPRLSHVPGKCSTTELLSKSGSFWFLCGWCFSSWTLPTFFVSLSICLTNFTSVVRPLPGLLAFHPHQLHNMSTF